MLEEISATPKRTNTELRKGLMALILAQVMVALNIVLAKYLLASVPLVFLLTTRFVFAACMLFPLHYASKARKKTLKHYFSSLNTKDYFFLFIQSLCGGALFNLFMFWGLNHTDANLAGIITSALPAIIAIMAWLILGDKISKKTMLCIGSATLGLFVIAMGKMEGPTIDHSLLGDILVFFALIPEAFYYVLCKIHPNHLPVFLVSALINAVNGLLMLIALFFIPFDASQILLEEWVILVVSALSSGLFYVFFFIGSQRVDSIMASITTAVMPLATVLFAWLILHEDLTVMECSGMGLVILSILIYARR